MTEDRGGRGHQVDENLKRVFEKTLSEELPDRFKDLLNQLKAGETPSQDNADSEK